MHREPLKSEFQVLGTERRTMQAARHRLQLLESLWTKSYGLHIRLAVHMVKKPIVSTYFSDDEFDTVRVVYFEACGYFDNVIKAAALDSRRMETEVAPIRPEVVRLSPFALLIFSDRHWNGRY
ncbi:hypothetical protein KM043_013188 [Ampulex compressa]|nr:hypothetical protein KM043_013188 [Ampulex compressa]